jgi:two-component system response regulator HydG
MVADVTGRVLVIDDDPDMCGLVEDVLVNHAFEVASGADAAGALQIVADCELDAVVTDFQLGSVNGLELCARISDRRPDLPVIILTAHADLDLAVQAMRVGAYDLVTKPFQAEVLALAVSRAVAHHRLRREAQKLREEIARPLSRMAGLVGESRLMGETFGLIDRVARSDASCLVTGESGTGKELVARAIHSGSARAGGPFLAINCAAVPAALLESELFGHVKGAFTDARRTRPGLFLQAAGGTLFLDEIGDMPLDTQAKLLRVLQERRLRPVGADQDVPFDTRLITATNCDLDTAVQEKRFREDLYYRVNVIRIHVPPLRSRGNDILLLAHSFLQRMARPGQRAHGVSSEAVRKLLAYDWPGNVRELENCMERSVALAREDEITVDDLPQRIRDHQTAQLIIAGDEPGEMPTLDEMAGSYIRRVLHAVQGNKSQAARVLGIDRRTLYRRMEQLRIVPSAPRGRETTKAHAIPG